MAYKANEIGTASKYGSVFAQVFLPPLSGGSSPEGITLFIDTWDGLCLDYSAENRRGALCLYPRVLAINHCVAQIECLPGQATRL